MSTKLLFPQADQVLYIFSLIFIPSLQSSLLLRESFIDLIIKKSFQEILTVNQTSKLLSKIKRTEMVCSLRWQIQLFMNTLEKMRPNSTPHTFLYTRR